MGKHHAYMVLIALFALTAATPSVAAADEPVWRHDVGLRIGGVGSLPIFLPLAGSVSAFYEAQLGRSWAVRPAIEATKGREWAVFGDMGYDISIGRVGAAMDFIYYTPSEMPSGTGLFLTAGVGLHRFDIKDREKSVLTQDDQWIREVPRDTQNAASLSVGIGYQFGRMFGMEMKYSASKQDSELAGGIGKNWLTASASLRFPMLGQHRDEHPSYAIHRTKKAAERTEKRAEKVAKRAEKKARADKLPLWTHKMGVSADLSSLEHAGAYAIFYEGHLDERWALRPALEYAHGSDVYQRSVLIDRAGLSFDCLYYASELRQNGTRFYMLAGLGTHWVSLRDEFGAWGGIGLGHTYTEYSGVVPALSVGLGYYFGRNCGMEYRRTFSTMDSPFPGSGGKNWWRLALCLRFPTP
jgi:opacity protein-like surface antigen